MYQAILTRVHAATNFRGTRLSARVKHPKGTQLIYRAYDYALSHEDNHRAAAFELTLEMQRCGLLDNGTHLTGNKLGDDYVWVLTPNQGE